jgi:hypothetical protein
VVATRMAGRASDRSRALAAVVVVALAIFGSRSAWSERPVRKERAARAEVAEDGESPGHTVLRASFEGSGYHDTDHVNVVTPTLGLTIADPVAGWSVGGSYLLDAVSAASVDIVSSATARWKELRHVGAGNIHYKPHDFGVDIGGGISREPDYLAIGVGGTLSWDLFDKNVTAVVGYSYGDELAGRAGTPFSVFGRRLLKTGLRAGVTVIVDPATTLDLLSEGVFERGDQAKPYRFVPLFEADAGARLPAGASVEEVNAARLSSRPAERLPLARNRLAITSRLAHRFSGSALHLEERLYNDDWGLRASTTDLRHVLDFGRGFFIWPHLRAHFQAPVSFWQRAYVATVAPDGAVGIPGLRTGDRELGPLRSFTAGGGLRFKFSSDQHTSWSFTVQGDAVITQYQDALFITRRTALFGALGLEAEMD